MANTDIIYSDNKKITAIEAENITPAVWVAFDQNSSGNCILEKQLPFSPDQTYFTITRSVDRILGLASNSTNIYAIYEDDVYFAERFSISNPLSIVTLLTFPSGIIESPIAVSCDDTYAWFLTPGIASGENAKLIRYDIGLTTHITIDLTKSGLTINNARSMVIEEDTGDIYIVTYTSPTQIIRVFELSGGGYDFAATNTI